MKFLVDAQLPPALALWIEARGHTAFAVRDIGLRDSPDADIWAWASKHDAVIVSKDEDFAILAALHHTPQILWVRFGNTTNAALFTRLEANWDAVIDLLTSGSPVVELR